MIIVKLHGSLDDLGGIVAFQRSLRGLNARSMNVYFHFQTGRVTTSRWQSVSLFRYLALSFSYIYFPFYLLYRAPDVIEINSSLVPKALKRDYWYARIASLVAPRAKLVLFNHGWNDGVKVKLLKKSKPWLSRYFGSFDCIIVLADRFRREIRAMGINTPVEVITTGIDVKEFGNFSKRRNPKTKRVLFLSRLEKEKGLVELLNAVPALLTHYPDLEVCIAGSGGYEEEARVHPSVLAHSENIRFLGYVRGDEKRNLLVSSDIFVFPSYYGEGCPVSVLEALAAGLPLVYAAAGALPDLLENGPNGIQIEAGSPREIEKAIMQLLGDPELMDEIAKNNKALSKRFDVKVIHEKLEKIYEGDS